MATRSYIAVVIKTEDKGRVITPDLVLLGKGICSNLKEPVFHNTTLEQGANVISIYHHWDGYPEGVGETLLDEFNDYEKALNLVSFGDASSINGVDATFYNSWREGEDWDFTQPKLYQDEDDYENHCMSGTDYLYLFKDGEWWVYSCYSDNPEWMPLASVIDNPSEDNE